MLNRKVAYIIKVKVNCQQVYRSALLFYVKFRYLTITMTNIFIEMNGFSVTLQRKKIKNINLRLSRTGEIQISAPIKTPLNTIHNFLHLKRSWIEMHRNRLILLKSDQPSQLISGEYINFQGNHYELQVHEVSTKPHVVLHENQLQFFISSHASKLDKELLLEKWYRNQMELILPFLFNKWQKIIGVTVNKINIKRMKSRWGSCHPIKKQITINLRLIEKPIICLEYVIVHELVHLLEASHNHRFQALMTHYLPEWKQIQKKLNFS